MTQILKSDLNLAKETMLKNESNPLIGAVLKLGKLLQNPKLQKVAALTLVAILSSKGLSRIISEIT